MWNSVCTFAINSNQINSARRPVSAVPRDSELETTVGMLNYLYSVNKFDVCSGPRLLAWAGVKGNARNFQPGNIILELCLVVEKPEEIDEDISRNGRPEQIAGRVRVKSNRNRRRINSKAKFDSSYDSPPRNIYFHLCNIHFGEVYINPEISRDVENIALSIKTTV